MRKGRGALQDIDQLGLMRPLAKHAFAVERVKDIVPVLKESFRLANEGVPGPVFVELPIDLLYPEPLIREWYGLKSESRRKGLMGKITQWYLERHTNRLFSEMEDVEIGTPLRISSWPLSGSRIRRAAARLKEAERPVLVIGSQAVDNPDTADQTAKAVERMGIPVYLSGMARGLLGANHQCHMRHKRKLALREADVVLLAGVPCDFRLDYGNHINREACLIAVNRDVVDLKRNRRPNISVHGEPGRFLKLVSEKVTNTRGEWFRRLTERQEAREQEITEQAAMETDHVNPLHLCKEIEEMLADDSLIVADGGDFVATASYILQPRRSLSWLDPGPFGTLGAGGGFALGAALCRPEADIWLIYGDGSSAYSLAEWDTFVRHGLGVIGVVGNDASWQQIARDQVEILKDPVGTVLRHTDYHDVAQGYGGVGFHISETDQIASTLENAVATAREKKPVLINVLLGKTDFRKGSISV
jgi:acetolactate synthase-1/2/3 large subunit